MIVDLNKYIKAKLFPSINKISNMYVYSDIIEQSPVVNSQVPIIRLF